MAVLEYAHLNVKVDLQRAIGEVKEACENIQRTTEHVRRKVEGMDVHAMMQRQERLCMSFAQDMYSQLYALGKEIHVRGIPDPFDMSRGKRRFRDRFETYGEKLARNREENSDILLDHEGRGPDRDKNGKVVKIICDSTNLMSNERSDYLSARCDQWDLPEMASQRALLKGNPVGEKIYQQWEKSKDVFFLRRNYA